MEAWILRSITRRSIALGLPPNKIAEMIIFVSNTTLIMKYSYGNRR